MANAERTTTTTLSFCVNQWAKTIYSGALIFEKAPIPEANDSLRDWIKENKLTSVGAMWGAAVGASLVHSGMKSSLKPSLRLIHARMHAQALTLAVLSTAAAIHYYENKKEERAPTNFFSTV